MPPPNTEDKTMAINGKVVLVTGSAQGIGRGIALRLAKDGADVCLVDMNKDKLDQVAGEVRALGRKATTFVADVSDRTQVFAAVDHAEKELGGFDVMVNNAGIAQVKALLDVTPEELERIFKINVNGVLWGIQAAATKFAVRGFTQAAARELASKGITVNAYCPGVVGTDMWVAIDEGFSKITGAPKGETYKKYCEGIALGRSETPDDVAAFVSYLAGPDSDYMTGQAVLIDGGMVYR